MESLAGKLFLGSAEVLERFHLEAIGFKGVGALK